jgi:hypothetical protein
MFLDRLMNVDALITVSIIKEEVAATFYRRREKFCSALRIYNTTAGKYVSLLFTKKKKKKSLNIIFGFSF